MCRRNGYDFDKCNILVVFDLTYDIIVLLTAGNVRPLAFLRWNPQVGRPGVKNHLEFLRWSPYCDLTIILSLEKNSDHKFILRYCFGNIDNVSQTYKIHKFCKYIDILYVV